jgi:molybdopterin biosynthesis enzyme
MRVIIAPQARAQIDYYVQKASIEISGVGRVLVHGVAMIPGKPALYAIPGTVVFSFLPDRESIQGVAL